MAASAHDRLDHAKDEGKSKREIVRCLKRYVAREVYERSPRDEGNAQLARKLGSATSRRVYVDRRIGSDYAVQSHELVRPQVRQARAEHDHSN
jgi:hypothetical protein